MTNEARKKLVNFFGYMGYGALTFLLLQAVALAVISVLQIAIFNHITPENPEQASSTDVFSTIYPIDRNVDIPEDNVIQTAALWIAATTVVIALTRIAGIIMSGLLRHTITGLSKKVTSSSLLYTKLLYGAYGFIVIVSSGMVVPAVYRILHLDVVIIFICIVAFLVQHSLSHRYRVPIARLI